MSVFLALSYVRCLFFLELLLFALSLLMQVVCILAGGALVERFGKPLVYAAFIVFVAVLGLAEDKNVWRNEFRRCPVWLRIAAVVCMLYELLVSAIGVSHGYALETEPFLASGLALLLLTMPVCILYSCLWTELASGGNSSGGSGFPSSCWQCAQP